MLYRYLLLPVFAGICFFCPNLNGQTALTCFGGDISSPNGSISFSAGQIAYTYHSNTEFELGQGIQQAFGMELLHYKGESDDYILQVFPNPTQNELRLTVSDVFLGSSLKIFSAEGRYISSKTIKALAQTISLDNLPTGTYFIHLTAPGKDSHPQVLKVIKV